MLTIEGLNTHYGASHVFQGVDLAVSARRISSVWPKRCRQDHDVADGDGPGAAERRPVSWMGSISRLAAASRSARRRRVRAGGAADLSRSVGR